MVAHRCVPFLIVAALCTGFLFVVFRSSSWRDIPQSLGLGHHEPTEYEKIHALPDLRTTRPKVDYPHIGEGVFKEPKIESSSPYPVGQTKPPGSNYTRCLVVARLKSESTAWIDEQLDDMLASGLLSKAVYTVDDRSAPLHPPRNKGHEVMVYLSYIIDFYDDLADVNIFMHAHRYTWHNNELLNNDASLMVRHLSPERVTRDGYMNLRCHWDPGCPSWLHPGATEKNPEKGEETLVADAWAELFPFDPIPAVLSQPCCAQFAVSKERVLALPKQRYVGLRDWVLRTELSDYMSGRVFEYTWQFLFTAAPLHCPSMSACYCDGYGYCFGSPQAFDYWFEMRYLRESYKQELHIWRERADLIEEARQRSTDGRVKEDALLEVPEPGRNVWLRDQIKNLTVEMERSRSAAFELGKEPRHRALEAGREWRDGDGY
ncbi:hypothetical protein BAUCODRAFT_149938 [Baudoinia panamericana UAMH 10762]|uniref:Uncharacterized protein n=1 Tax=Baudoinia panamericana (strain UAMH 10762) TaxID=717646 RepID=M2MTJ0_BAUPA|nr:uncharacterized protein BAUCODRAFT_149938 [Baudoinia panamericana UAMH 10762]EMC94853.1 hypothetical protein BAUCODRAFT_149938 [Baudoinia panamericana UAMH 10762]